MELVYKVLAAGCTVTRAPPHPPLPCCLQDAVFQNAIVGGTGIYNGASGTLTIATIKDGMRWRLDAALMQQPNCTAV